MLRMTFWPTYISDFTPLSFIIAVALCAIRLCVIRFFSTFACIRFVFCSLCTSLPSIPTFFVRSSTCSAFAFSFAHIITP